MNSKERVFKPDLYVVARIINTLIKEGSMNKTKLSTFSNLSYDKFLEYLEWLKEKQLVKEEDGKISVLEKGVETYDKLVNWILIYVGKLKFKRL